MITVSIIFTVMLLAGVSYYFAKQHADITIVNMIEIDATQEIVYHKISKFSEYPTWSPFLAQDPSQKYHTKGLDGAIGSQYFWEGNSGKDAGYQEITSSKPLHELTIDVHIEKPFKAQPKFRYTIENKGTTTLVTQVFTLQSSLADAFFLWLFSVRKDMDRTNKQGLQLLKKTIEGS